MRGAHECVPQRSVWPEPTTAHRLTGWTSAAVAGDLRISIAKAFCLFNELSIALRSKRKQFVPRLRAHPFLRKKDVADNGVCTGSHITGRVAGVARRLRRTEGATGSQECNERTHDLDIVTKGGDVFIVTTRGARLRK
eukprot:7390143-Prymnesium_polylepis.1